MRILYFNHTSSVGGASWCLLEIIQGLDRKQFEPVVVLRQPGPLVEELKKLDVEVLIDESCFSILSERYPSKFPWFWAGVFCTMVRQCIRLSSADCSVARMCEQVKPDIVHLNSCVLLPLARPAFRASSSPKVVLHIRDHWQSYGWAPFREWIRRRFLKRYVSDVLSITHTGAQCFGAEERAVIARDWPDFKTRDETRDVYSDFGIETGTPFFLVPGGIHPSKGTVVAVRAFKQLLKTHKAALVILGMPPPERSTLAASIKKQLNRFGVSFASSRIYQEAVSAPESIHILGYTQNIKPFITAATAVLCPFTVPHAAKAALEAGFLGKVAVVSDNGEGREYVKADETGFIVSPGNADALCDVMRTILDHPEIVEKMATAAQRFVRENFSEEKSLSEIKKVYQGQ